MQPLTSLTFGKIIPTYLDEHLCVKTPADRIPPFQIVRPARAIGVAGLTVYAVKKSDGSTIDLKALLDPTDPMEILQLTTGIDVIVWKQIEPLTAYIDSSIFYVKVSDGVDTWYSRYMLQVKCGNIVSYPTEGIEDISVTVDNITIM